MSVKILTPSGYQSFGGVQRIWHDEVMHITTVSGREFHTSPRHIFMQHGVNPIFAEEMECGWNIGEDQIASIQKIQKGMWLYDPLNVDNGHVYVHDGSCMSHNSFNQTSSTLIDMEFLMMLEAEDPIGNSSGVSIYEKPVEGHNYIMLVDVGKGRGLDYSTFSMIDITSSPAKQVATFRDNNVSPMILPNLLYKVAKSYNEAFVIVEANAGEVVYKILYYDLEYENCFSSAVRGGRSMGLELNKKVKRIGCSNLKDLIEQHQLKIVDENTIQELYVYEAHGDSYEARRGSHDDMIAGLVMFGWFADTEMFGQMTTTRLRDMMDEERRALVESSVPLLGFLDDENSAEMYELWGDVDTNIKWTVEGINPDWDITQRDQEDPYDYLF